MSEAAVQLLPAADFLPVPKGCTPRQLKLARLLLDRDPNSQESLASMVREAGYAYTTSTQMARPILDGLGVARAIAHLKAEQPDSARELKLKAMNRLGARIDTMDDGPLIGAVKVLSDIEAASPPSDAVSSGIPRSWYKGQMRRWLAAMWRRGYRAGLAASGALSPSGSPPSEVP